MMQEIKKMEMEFFKRDGNSFLAWLRDQDRLVLVAEYQGEQYCCHQAEYPWWEWEVYHKLFEEFKKSKKLVLRQCTKKERGLVFHELRIFQGGWIVVETSIRTIICTHKSIYVFYYPELDEKYNVILRKMKEEVRKK